VFPTHKQHLQNKRQINKGKNKNKNKSFPKARKQLYNKKWNIRTHKKEQKQAKITKKKSLFFVCC
jgi:hypothetical protein